MASAWSKLSKEEQEASGMNKKEYNAAHGKKSSRETTSNKAQDLINRHTSSDFQEKKVSGTEAANKPATSSSSSSSSSASEAKERAQNYSYYKADEGRFSRGGTTYYGEEARQQKAADDKARNERMHANKIAEFGEDLKGYSKETGRNIHGRNWNQQQKYEREKSNDAYRQSRLDFQAVKAEHGPAGVYGMQSAKGKYGPGGGQHGERWFDDPNKDAFDKDNQKYAIRRTLESSGYDFNYDEIQRSKNFGEFQKQNMHLYDQYGEGEEGYNNWYNNYSIYGGENGMTREKLQSMVDGNTTIGGNYQYSLGNFTGSQDIMEFDKVMEIGQNQQNAMKEYQASDEYKNKYGQYDWAYK